jgi:hypothetical protein
MPGELVCGICVALPQRPREDPARRGRLARIGDEILKVLEGGGCQLAWYNPMRRARSEEQTRPASAGSRRAPSAPSRRPSPFVHHEGDDAGDRPGPPRPEQPAHPSPERQRAFRLAPQRIGRESVSPMPVDALPAETRRAASRHDALAGRAEPSAPCGRLACSVRLRSGHGGPYSNFLTRTAGLGVPR